ncbi:hypothetical protein ACJIZ3_014968 [Penstemon smallii]|uniref:Protein PHLOEM PROTEIN 2-LIKE A10 n=1 Tax=Penstemon smallii TaxID=265156 RepID=A0ABD3RLB7_9LAMI
MLKKGLDYTKKRRNRVLVLGALGLTSYGAYKIYNLPSVVKKRQNLLKLLNALVSVAEMVSDSAEAIGILSKDLKEFIKSDSNQIPQSFKQISKITTSNEFSESLTWITRALTIGILRAYRSPEVVMYGRSIDVESCFTDRVVDKLFSDSGSDFASVVVGSLTRNLVTAYYSIGQHDYVHSDYLQSKSNKNVARWIELVSEDNFRELIGNYIKLFVSTAITVYLDKTMNINTYEELFSGLTNLKHENRVRDMLTYVCNNAVETAIKTHSNLNSSCTKLGKFEDSFCGNEIGTKLISATLQKAKNLDRGLGRKMSSILVVPRNRKFVLEMTGMVTFETIRSFLEFLLEKLSECVKRSVDVVQREVVDRGVEVIRYVSCRSTTVASVCISICLHILNGPWILAPC